MRTTIIAKIQVPGTHQWSTMPEGLPQQYLKNRHRHLFKIVARITLPSDADMSNHHRCIEFIELQQEIWRGISTLYARNQGQVEFGDRSCESIARELAGFLALAVSGCAAVVVEVWEDGENGAAVEWMEP